MLLVELGKEKMHAVAQHLLMRDDIKCDSFKIDFTFSINQGFKGM